MRFINIKKLKLINIIKFPIKVGRLFLLLLIYIVYQVLLWTIHLFRIPDTLFRKVFKVIVNQLDPPRPDTIKLSYLIELSFRNLAQKKSRSLVTIGGMAVGIGIVVYLVSIGYGLERLVIGRISNLAEMKQINVSTQVGSKLRIDETTIATVKNWQEVENVLPIISAAGKITYQNSASDVAIYGVTKSYLEASSLDLASGKLIESDDLVKTLPTDIITINPNSADSVEIFIEEIVLPEDYIIKDQITSTTVSFEDPEPHEIIVNQSLLEVFGFNETDALDKELFMNITIVGDLLDKPSIHIETSPIKYKIVGVINDDNVPIAYIPFIDLKSLNVKNYSQIKVILKDEDEIDKVRTQIDSMGFTTTSVVDTVRQVTEMFASLRLVLIGVGFVALFIASLGTFNTLTVSLIERTKEFGLMKTMGMKNIDVINLFFMESLAISLFGGLFGLLFGYIAGKLTGVAVSMITLANEVKYISVSHIPFDFMVIIIIISFLIGILTGFYPARRASKISALDALRYE